MSIKGCAGMGKETKGEIGPVLSPLIEGDDRRKAFHRRRDLFEYKKVSKEDEKKLATDGWELHKALQTYSWIKKKKFPDTILEDRIWCLFYRMGYPVLSGQKFQIQTRAQDGSTSLRRVNVLAKDDETVIVVECRARETRGKKSFTNEIEELDQSQKAISRSIRSHFGKGYDPKIIWIIVTCH